MKPQPTCVVISEIEYAQLITTGQWLDDPDGEREYEEVAIICPVCEGDGKDPDGDPGCATCQGTGIGRGDPNTSRCGCHRGRASKYDAQCPECEGHGYRWLELPTIVATRLATEHKLLDNPSGMAYDVECWDDYPERDEDLDDLTRRME
ncbi:MAG: hypothetical protein PHN49_01995 [Candidatus Omnitrophica bacterium]|nr:hypothetical protein [Candidatus Omnitrophota bacterium]